MCEACPLEKSGRDANKCENRMKEAANWRSCALILHEPSNLHPDFRSMWRSKYAFTSLAARQNIAFCENCHLYINETIYVKCFCPKQHFHKTRFVVPVRVRAFWRGICSDATFYSVL